MPGAGEREQGLLLGLLHDGCPHGHARALATGTDPRAQANALADAWHIHTAGEARGMLAWLLEEGHRALYPQVCRILFAVPRAAREREIVRLDQVFDPVRLALCVDNLERALPGLRESRFIVSGQDLARGVLAWDMSRAIHVARMAYDCGMQTDAQAWAVIERAAAQVFAQYASWEQVVASYLLGRAMWAGPDAGFSRHVAFARACIDDAASPWQASSYPGQEPGRGAM
ncbi:DUF1266 domain-containing protein [Cupriavidus sp. 30B13]|uniref:DUF1266 domain-containing protein n=1 Tax=Cupriavidus sp. 30B13 TaxID=3384241 RepID=UPI003B91AB14